jgi:hypothetical protein
MRDALSIHKTPSDFISVPTVCERGSIIGRITHQYYGNLHDVVTK